MTTIAHWAEHAYTLAKFAGEKIMEYYLDEKSFSLEYKTDNSPLTTADKTAHDIIMQGLIHYVLDEKGSAPVLSEEGKQIPFEERRAWQRYWCVDPLDGTREFLAHNGEFAVNIALIENHQPTVGVIYAPALKYGYLAWRGGGAYLHDALGNIQRITTTKPPHRPLRVVLSRHYNPIKVKSLLANFGEVIVQQQGSALKFGCLASGEVDLMVRLSLTACEWDNAAGQCLVEEAGGMVISLTEQPLTYNQSSSLTQGGFLAVGDGAVNWLKNLKISS